MKILQLGKFYPPDIGGIENVMQDITEALNARGIKCDVLCSNSALHYKEDIIACGARIMRVASFGKIASTSIAPQMITKLRNIIKQYDIIHLHLPDPMANVALLLSDFSNKTIILHWHSDIVRQKNLLKLYMPLQTKLLKIANAIIATSKKYMLESAFLSSYLDKCVCIPIGIDEHLLLDSNVNIAISNLPNDKKIIFSLGRFTAKKGFEYLIESAKYVSDDYVVCIGGSGDTTITNKFLRLIQENNLGKKVFLLGKIERSDLAYFYKKSHIFVLPSLQESYGLVLVESMCAGLPIISTKLSPSGVDWVNQDGVSGIIVPPKNAKAIADAVIKIEQNYDFFSKNAYSRFREHFTQDKMIDSIIHLYTNLLKGD